MGYPHEEDEEEEVISLTMVGARELLVAKDPSPTIEDSFGDLNPEGHQTNTASLEAVEGGEETKAIKAKEVMIDGGHEVNAQASQVCDEGTHRDSVQQAVQAMHSLRLRSCT